MSQRPNILLLMTDQMRGDTMGISGHPVVQTPMLDEIGTAGFHFTRGLSACPICIPARRTLMSGQSAATHGCTVNAQKWLDAPTLPGVLADSGYQTHLCGKIHLWPERKYYGFQSMDWADGPGCQAHEKPHGKGDADADYARWVNRELGRYDIVRPQVYHGIGGNSWNSRSWPWEERLHFNNWCTDRALSFLSRRDPTRPFFLKVSYFDPHPPITPPEHYYQRYLNMELPEPVEAAWSTIFEKAQTGLRLNNPGRIKLTPQLMKQFRASYYASINHINDQLSRIIHVIPQNTVVIFTSDHGEMLGDHQMYAKSKPYEPSVRVPFLIRLPRSMGIEQRKTIDTPVELMDIMPTCLDLAGADIPDTVEGKSLVPLMKGESFDREYLHGETASPQLHQGGMQFMTDRRFKYVWFPGLGKEQYFDLQEDPQELVDLASPEHRDGYEADIALWRERLVQKLEARPEGFVKNGKLAMLEGPVPGVVPGHRVNDWPVEYFN